VLRQALCLVIEKDDMDIKRNTQENDPPEGVLPR